MSARLNSRFAVLLLVAATLEAAPPSNTITAVRYWEFADATRVVIEVDREFEYQWDRVPNPDRVFFDLLHCRFPPGRKGLQTIQVGNELLLRLRMAETQPGVARVVLDLGEGVEYTATRLSNPERLVIELRKAQSGTTPPVTSEIPATSPPATAEPAPETPASGGHRLYSPPKPKPARGPVLAGPGPTLPRNPLPLDVIAQLTRRAGPSSSTRVPAPLAASAKPVKLEPPTVAAPPADANAAAASTAPVPPAAKPAKLSAGAQSMTRVLGLKIGRIVLDPGHGGHDTGTMGPGGLLEKDLVLDVCKRLAALIETRMNAQVVLTRSDDTFVPLERRTALANERRADLFLSVHANSSPLKASSGVETFFLNFTSNKAALEVAARENASSQKTVYELKDLIQKIAMQEKVDESRQFAAKVQQSLHSASFRANARSRDRGVKQAPFVVLIGASMPSVLAEIGFVSNPRDEALFKKPDFRQKIAEGLYRGISQYANTLSHFQVARN